MPLVGPTKVCRTFHHSKRDRQTDRDRQAEIDTKRDGHTHGHIEIQGSTQKGKYIHEVLKEFRRT